MIKKEKDDIFPGCRGYYRAIFFMAYSMDFQGFKKSTNALVLVPCCMGYWNGLGVYSFKIDISLEFSHSHAYH